MILPLEGAVDELLARIDDGPMQFRFVLQPLMAICIGFLDGRRDARAGLPPFLWGLVAGGGGRMARLNSGLWRLRFPVIIAASLDALAQFIMFGHVRPLSALIVGSSLMAIPYAVSRGLTNRFQRKSRVLVKTAHGGG